MCIYFANLLLNIYIYIYIYNTNKHMTSWKIKNGQPEKNKLNAMRQKKQRMT
jgi:hypothetical protein